uniref:Uncharacterized protein n=1 Tax=Anguilla anguilla TaxID=7936 RepID=A0A0E9RAP2_ANGAN
MVSGAQLKMKCTTALVHAKGYLEHSVIR